MKTPYFRIVPASIRAGLILLDSLMPGMDGFELETVRRHLHVQWQYASHNDVTAPTSASQDDNGEHNTLPEADRIRTLLALAKKGHLKKLLAMLDEIENTGPRSWHACTTQSRQFARGFQMN